MRIQIIAAALPPQLDGIGDYTANLAAELAHSATVTVLTGAQVPDPIPGVRVETAFSAADPRSVWNLTRHVAEDKPDWVLLQYNPFSYGRWGKNLHLPHVMRQIKRDLPGTRFALMVHEPFVPIISPQFAVMATWQRWQLWALGRSADRVFFSIDPWAKRFQEWFPHTQARHLPVGSNIPRVPISRAEARARLGIEDQTIVLGLFGTMSAGRMLTQVQEAAITLRQSGHRVKVLYIGPHNEQVCAALGNTDLIADGPAAPEEVSRRFAAMDIYLVPYSDGISTRRTTLMVALQHGIATVGTSGLLTDSLFERENGQAFLLADVNAPEQFQSHVLRLAEDAALREQIGRAGMLLYKREFAWTEVVQKLHTALAGVEDPFA